MQYSSVDLARNRYVLVYSTCIRDIMYQVPGTGTGTNNTTAALIVSGCPCVDAGAITSQATAKSRFCM